MSIRFGLFPGIHHCAGIVAGLLLCSAPALAGGVVKVDESTIAGEVLSFDGQNVLVQTGTVDGQPVRQSLPLQDLLRVRFAGGSPGIAIQRPTFSSSTGTSPAPAGAAGTSTGVRPASGQPAPAITLPAPTRRSGSVVPSLPPPEAPQPLSLPANWMLKTADGDLLEGRIRSWSRETISFEFRQNAPLIEAPTARVTEIWRVDQELVRRARALKAGSEAEDVAYVIRDRDIVAVKGVAMGIEGESLNFRYEGQDRRISVARLLGVVLVPQKAAAPSDAERGTFHQSLVLTNGVLLGHWKSLKDDVLTFQTLLGPALSLPVNSVIALENRNGRVVYVSDLDPVKVEQTPYFDRMMPYRTDTSLVGGPLRLSDGEYAHGIAVHSRCVLEYDISAGFETFRSKLGFDPQGPIGRAAIRVLVDGKAIYENIDARGDQKIIELELPIQGARRLVLEVDFGEDQDVGDRVIWAGTRLIRTEVGK